MASCRIINGLYAAIPLRLFRDFLVRRHLEKCAVCQARLVSRDEASALFVRPEDVGSVERMWNRVVDRTVLSAPSSNRSPIAPVRRAPLRLPWEWAAGAVTLLLTAAAGFWLLRGIQATNGLPGAASVQAPFEINYINAGGAPAQAYVYRPNDSDTIFIWAERVL